MQASRIAFRNLRSSKNVLKKTGKRSYLYDMRGTRVMDDTGQGPHVKPWNQWDLRTASMRMRRFESYGLWFVVGLGVYTMYRGQVKRKIYWQLERWDYEDKYWKDGYWIKEFPEGMCEITWANGATSTEPGFSNNDYKKKFWNKIYRVD